jgi:hypothetical protein
MRAALTTTIVTNIVQVNKNQNSSASEVFGIDGVFFASTDSKCLSRKDHPLLTTEAI